ncbi:hypothetical protein B0A50_00675 [Salinomyces thailandicus]|uniref:Ribosomal RNA-processing protein 7 n=1 Tax=Salinomyces thailandicus TaxID=706561 RepID=A0A4U0UE61_9PEZI|nr:hypothetical protein B0A50_00675 [Salinomyces thailandica]
MVPMPSKHHAVANAVNEFTVLPLALPPTSSFPKKATHYLYLRPNAPKLPTADTPREVFLVNVPVDSTETHIRALFAGQLGGSRIDRVDFEGARAGKGITAPVTSVKKGRKRKRTDAEGNVSTAEEVGKLPETWDRELHRSGGTAIVTFVDKASSDLAMKEARKAAKAGQEIQWSLVIEAQAKLLGSARYTAHHSLAYPDSAVLQQSVDDFMTAFSAQESARSRALTKQRSVPDSDGFVTVTRGGRAGPAREEEAREKGEELKKREKQRVGEDFYRFQTREKRKAEQMDLVKGFEEDRRRLEEMRKRRGKVRPE